MAPRPYVSRVRAAAAEATRGRVIEAAAEFLRKEPLSAFSLDTVAKAAGVTRLTVYNQFGSRRGLLEAVFDHLAERGRLGRIEDAVTDRDPRRGLERLAEVFCDFWSGDLAIGRLHDAMATDTEFAQALTERNERRRDAITALVERLPLETSARQRKDAIDLIFALMSYPVFRLLSEGRSPADTGALVKAACASALTRIDAGP
ncbi:MAG TPA: TetR/AcrR family transcriptional regulator [Phenylobacterium sp.]|nr:TetR/AcrR family transcriptional regulator [Phenylobacterium sp.]